MKIYQRILIPGSNGLGARALKKWEINQLVDLAGLSVQLKPWVIGFALLQDRLYKLEFPLRTYWVAVANVDLDARVVSQILRGAISKMLGWWPAMNSAIIIGADLTHFLIVNTILLENTGLAAQPNPHLRVSNHAIQSTGRITKVIKYLLPPLIPSTEKNK